MLPRIPCRTTTPLALAYPKLSDQPLPIFPNSYRHQARHLPLRWHNALLDAQSPNPTSKETAEPEYLSSYIYIGHYVTKKKKTTESYSLALKNLRFARPGLFTPRIFYLRQYCKVTVRG